MRYRAALAAIFVFVAAALIWSETRKIQAPISPEPILNFVADTQRELTRLPVAFAPLPDSKEIELGNELEKLYAGQWTEETADGQTRAIRNYIQQVGAREAAHAHRKLPYRFHYIPDLDFTNAFALPGGPVFIGGGMIALMDTEDELAAVLGHEIEHIDHYHCAERAQVEAALQRVPLGDLVAVPVEVFVAGYSKDQELEADREGARLAIATGYSPLGAIRMFEALERLYPTEKNAASNPAEEASDIAWKTLAGYFRSHPPNAERIDEIQKLIARDRLSVPQQMKPLPVAYFFLTERALRSLEAARHLPPAFLTRKERQQWEQDRAKDYNQAIKLASQSLALNPDQPRAIETIALAHLDQGDYAGTAAAYRKLLSPSPAFADDIRKQIDASAEKALASQQYDRALKLARQSLELQPNGAQALQILAETQLSVSDFTGAAETARRLASMYSDAAEALRTYAEQLAASQLAKRHYLEAAGCATAALALKPGQETSLTVLAKAQFSLANFAQAANAYRKLLDRNPVDAGLARSYAEALSATDSQPGARHEFESWMAGVRSFDPALTSQLHVELAGLKLMAGDETDARTISAQAERLGANIAPELLGRLGWWYYRAGKYDASTAILSRELAQRPADSQMQAALAWNELERRQPQEALRHFTAAVADPEWSSPHMGRAFAHWQAGQTNDALKEFEAALQAQPEWTNPRWVARLYPASVAQAVNQMDAAWQARQAEKNRNRIKTGSAARTASAASGLQ